MEGSNAWLFSVLKKAQALNENSSPNAKINIWLDSMGFAKVKLDRIVWREVGIQTSHPSLLNIQKVYISTVDMKILFAYNNMIL